MFKENDYIYYELYGRNNKKLKSEIVGVVLNKTHFKTVIEKWPKRFFNAPSISKYLDF